MWVKVVEVRADPAGADGGQQRIALSMKLVAQDTGEDLDAGDAQAAALAGGGGGGPGGGGRLSAMYYVPPDPALCNLEPQNLKPEP